LTGCSAGGTVLSVAYDLIYKHYHGSTSAGGVRKKKKKKRMGPRISVIGDSPTYLSPSSFLKDNYEHWNPKTMMTRVLGKNFNKWRYSDEYPTRAWDYTLKQGSKKDQWGLISHTDDPISLFYFRITSGPIAESLGDGNQTADRLSRESLVHKFTGYLSTIQKRHKNVATYFIESRGHCSFGLYYALQEGFEAWASDIL
jgi:hypothetical protein